MAETRADLEEFQQSSKELEEEMNLEIERTERAQQEQKAKALRVEAERDEWKVSLSVLYAYVSLPDFTIPVQVHDASDLS